MRINGFEQIKGFYSWVFNNQELGIKPQHCSLYVFLINQNNRNNWVEWFKCPLDLAMAGSCITSKKTYYRCLKDLTDWNLIEYTPGENNWKAPVIKIKPLKDRLNVPISEIVEVSHSTSTITSTTPQVELPPIPLLTPLPTQATTPLHTPLHTPNIKHVTGNLKQVTITTENENTKDEKIVVDAVEDNFKKATDFKELPTHIQKLCKDLIKNNIRFSKVTDEILELGVITFLNKEIYLQRRVFSTRIPDVFYYATGGAKYHSLLDLLFYLMSNELDKEQIKMTTGLQDDKSISDWVLSYAKHVFLDNKSLTISGMRNHIKNCWKSRPGEEFREEQAKKITKYNR